MAFFDELAERTAQGVARFVERVINYIPVERQLVDKKKEDYYSGKHTPQLKLKPGQWNDNVATNYVGLAIDRSISLLWSGGVEFKYQDETDPRQEFIENVWEANKQEIFLQNWGMDGEVFGTGYIEIQPEGLFYNGASYPRLILLKPSLMAIETDPLDGEKVLAYIMDNVKVGDKAYRKIVRRIVTPDLRDSDGIVIEARPDMWIIEVWESSGFFSTWKLISETPWEYEFPPIIHNKNLPSIHSVYGSGGIDDAIELQDKYNFTMSNIVKIIRYWASPKTWGRGIDGKLDKMQWGVDDVVLIRSENGMIANLEMNADLQSSFAVASALRQSIFEMARVVDTQAFTSGGDLTQYKISAIYSDALSKNRTRRLLYGEALTELNRRLLALGGFEDTTPPEIEWGEELPSDEQVNSQLILNDLAAQIISRKTAAELRGYEWEDDEGEKMRIENEKNSGDAGVNNALANFFAGRERTR